MLPAHQLRGAVQHRGADENSEQPETNAPEVSKADVEQEGLGVVEADGYDKECVENQSYNEQA